MKFLSPLCFFMLLFCTTTNAAIVNSNHLYQKSQLIQQRLVLIRQADNLPKDTWQPGIQANKLAVHLYAKVGEIAFKTNQLQAKLGLQQSEVPQLPFSTIRPRSVMPPLQKIDDQLVAVMQKLSLDPDIPEPERPLGKTVEDVYRNLWYISGQFDGLVPATSFTQVYDASQKVLKELELLGKKAGLKVKVPSATLSYQNKTARDTNLVAYQNLHLIGRLLRHLQVEATVPGQFPVGEQTPADTYDSTLNMLVELHKAKVSKGLEQSVALQKSTGLKTADQVYAEQKRIHKALLGIL